MRIWAWIKGWLFDDGAEDYTVYFEAPKVPPKGDPPAIDTKSEVSGIGCVEPGSMVKVEDPSMSGMLRSFYSPVLIDQARKIDYKKLMPGIHEDLHRILADREDE